MLAAPPAVAAEQDVALIEEGFSAQTDPANFGFPTGARVADGVLHLTESMANYSTSIKTLSPEVAAQDTLDLTFDWKTAITSSGMKTGLELRDADGHLAFALAATGTELRYATAGPVSDSSRAPDDLNPTWIKTNYDRSKWYTINLHLDFTVGTAQYTITTKETGARVMASGFGKIEATNLAKMVAANYYGTGAQSIDNVVLRAPQYAAHGTLRGKSAYTFGDSIVYGHQYPRGFGELIAEREGMVVTKHARNGATILPSDNQVLTQVERASSQAPDYVIFDGGTNDAYPTSLDLDEYERSLTATIQTMKNKWPTTQIVYVAVHKLGSRDWDTQVALRELTLKVCRDHGVAVADVFGNSTLDTRDEAQRIAYTFDGLVNGYPGTSGTGTHPNLVGLTTFYVPLVTAKLSQLQRLNIRGLLDLVAHASQINGEEYTGDSWTRVRDEMNYAEDVLSNVGADQDEVDTALGNLGAALNALTPLGASIDVQVSPRCMTGKAYLAVRATNTESRSLAITFTTPYGTRSFMNVEPGGSAYQSFASRQTNTPATTVRVDVHDMLGEAITSSEVVSPQITCL